MKKNRHHWSNQSIQRPIQSTSNYLRADFFVESFFLRFGGAEDDGGRGIGDAIADLAADDEVDSM